MSPLKPAELVALAGLVLLALLALSMAGGWIDGSMAAKTIIAVLGDVINLFRSHP